MAMARDMKYSPNQVPVNPPPTLTNVYALDARLFILGPTGHKPTENAQRRFNRRRGAFGLRWL